MASRCVLAALVTVTVSWSAGGAANYDYPYRDPYLATVTAAIVNADRLSPRPKREILYIRGVPGRDRLPSLAGRNLLSVAFYPQTRPAPLVFIVAGVGTTPFLGPATYYAALLHQDGSHVVVLPSPMSWNFALAASRSGAPGYTPDDARDLYETMQRTLSAITQRYGIRITGISFMGMSLGALEGAFVSVLDADEGKVGIGKYLLVNPPLDLGRALRTIDEWHALGAKLGAERAKGVVAKALSIYDSFDNERRDDPAIFEVFAKYFAVFSREELQFLIAEDLQASLPELAHVARIIQGQAAGPFPRVEAKKRLRETITVSLATYRQTIALPVWKRAASEPEADLDTFIRRGDLASVIDRLRDNPRVHVVHNMDDVLADPRAMAELKETLGDRMTLYAWGGHLGNLWFPENRDLVRRFFRP